MSIFRRKNENMVENSDNLPPKVKEAMRLIKEDNSNQDIDNIKDEVKLDPIKKLAENSRLNYIPGLDVQIETIQRIIVNGKIMKEVLIKSENVEGELRW